MLRIRCPDDSPLAREGRVRGRLQDIGIGGISIALSEYDLPKPASQEALWGAVGEMHGEASGLMAKLRKLDLAVQRVLRLHHSFGKDEVRHPMVAVVCVAEPISRDLGRGVLQCTADWDGKEIHLRMDACPTPQVQTALDRLDISPDISTSLLTW